MRDRDLYGRILGLCEPWFVDDVELREGSEEVVVQIGRRKDTCLECPECGEPVPGYDTQPRQWRHLDTCQYQTILRAEVPRANCPEHGVHQIKVPWAEDRSRFTMLFESLAIDWMQEAGRSAVARRMGLSWDEADGIMQRAVARGLERRKNTVISRIGVDEKSFQKHHEYVTTVCALDHGHVLYVGDDRKQATLDAYYQSLTPEQRTGIKAVAMDMWDPYVASTQQHVPDADIVYDKFHIAKHLNEAVDKVRREEHKALLIQGDTQLKGTKYSWLMNPMNFTPRAWRDFKRLREGKLRTARAWALKETIMELWDYSYVGVAQRFFDRWHSWAVRSRLEPIKKAARMLKQRLPNILTYLTHYITNATSESLNSKIQWIKYTARGFRNRARFRNAIYFHCGGLDLYPH